MKKEIKKKPKEIFIIENQKSSPKWKIKYPHCTCSVKDLGDCKHCHYTIAENSVPREIYYINVRDESGIPQQVKVKGVKLVLGTDDNVSGWQGIF